MMMDEMFDAVVVEADGVEHSRRRLDGARRRVADARLARDGFGDDAAQPREIDEAGHLPCVAERARGHEDGIAQAKAAEGDGKVGHDASILIGPMGYRTYKSYKS